jgi:hypothetical protein
LAVAGDAHTLCQTIKRCELIRALPAARQSTALETKTAALDAKINVEQRTVLDLDRRLNQIDLAIETAAKRGKSGTFLSAIESQRKARTALASERNEAAGTPSTAALKAERATVAPAARDRGRARPLGGDTDSERAIRWLIEWSCTATRSPSP